MQVIPRLLLFFGFKTLPIFVLVLSLVDYYYDYLVQEDAHNQVFDYIIVGAGSAGSVLANRLSKNNKVLLLEAGGNPLPFVNSVPALSSQILHLSQVDWLHRTVTQKNSFLSSEDHISRWPRGKMLGGTSNLNYMYYVRGHPLDFDNWANLTGDPSWKYENVLPNYKSCLKYNGQFKSNEKHYGTSPYGHLHVEENSFKPLYSYIRDAGKELGYEEFDLNAPQRSGLGPFEVTQRIGERFSTFDAFLNNIQSRRNLHIARYAQATKIKLDSKNRAVGIWYFQHGVKKFASAVREIIVSTGAIDSPKLLMLSGIGPKNHLQSIGIKPRVDLPVGQNLKDHLAVMLLNVLIDKPMSFIPERDFGVSTLIDYLIYGKGILTSSVGGQAQIFMSTSEVKKSGVDWPNIQLYVFGLGLYDSLASDFSKTFGINQQNLEEFVNPFTGKDAVILMPTILRPKSVGEILLKDRNPLTSLLIDPHYLEHPQDVKDLVEGLQFAVKLVETTDAFKSLNARIAGVKFPPCKHHKFKSDAYFECYIRHVGATMYHPTGTCRMGKLSDPRTVVDSKLRVKGVRGLRVADASIMPEIVSGNTNAPSIMIGEKASDIIRDFWSQQFLICDKFEYALKQGVSDKLCYYSQIV